MPNNLTDAEIKKALECCAKNEDECTTECPLWLNDASCFSYLVKPILDLINRQEARIEKLEKVEHFADKTIATQKAEIERLKKITGFTPARGSGKSPFLNMVLDNVRAEAHKECIEKVKKLWGNYRGYDFERKLDNLLNELAGDK